MASFRDLLHEPRGLSAFDSQADKRAGSRARTAYLPCCVRSGKKCDAGLIRDISPDGLMVATTLDAEPGSEIEYLLDGGNWRRARVVWRRDRRLGVENLEPKTGEPSLFPCRALRIPPSAVARMRIGERTVEIGIGNISQRGMLAFGVPPLLRGQVATLTILGRPVPDAALRWWADGSAGLEFERPITLRELTELLELAGSAACGVNFDRKIGELLEVVPANDSDG